MLRRFVAAAVVLLFAVGLILAEESKGVLGREVAAALSAVIDAAQGEVLKYRRLLENDAPRPAQDADA